MTLENNNLKYLAGNYNVDDSIRPFTPYDELVCDFLNSLSVALLSDAGYRQYPDVISFAYWCRKANIARLKREFSEKYLRLGLGLVFHVTPSNVPINFAFSFVFSLLAGNANIVRVPSKDFPQTDILCKVIDQLFGLGKYKEIASMNAFVKYQQNDSVTALFSSRCNARIIWGGDDTINNIRKLAMPEKSTDIVFSDRYSFCMIDIKNILRIDDKELSGLASAFYNDTYLMDQNACSSPHMIVWIGKADDLKAAQAKFWDALHKELSVRYDLQPVYAVDKYTQICSKAVDLDCISGCCRHGNLIYRIQLNEIPANMDSLRGKCGFFYEFCTENPNDLACAINRKFQTLTYFGIDNAALADFVIKNRLSGIDRIVPIGSALDIGVIWDGYDLVRSLSRICEIH